MPNSIIPGERDSKVLVVGAYGLIGYGITRQLREDGYDVVGLGRDRITANRVIPDIEWLIEDIGTLCEVEDWIRILKDVAFVVNCSGALQDGPSDDLELVHVRAVSSMAKACKIADIGLVQISAIGAHLDASTAFLRTKAQGDAAIRASGARFHIFRPGLVLAAQAYGGSSMLRMLSAVPFVQLIAYPQALVQTVSLDDIACAVSAAIEGKIPAGFEGDLAEQEPHELRDVVATIRHWMGFDAARMEIRLPKFGAVLVGRLADLVSCFGWRPPLRTTAMKVLEAGVTATPSRMSEYGLPQQSTLTQTLSKLPTSAESRLSARMLLLMPFVIATLVLFWLLSGLIGFARVNTAALTLEAAGWPHLLAVLSVLFWACVDIGIAVAFCVRKYAAIACWAAFIVSGFYLMASTLVVPHLWVDPLGPLTKVIPGMLLAVVARVGLEAR